MSLCLRLRNAQFLGQSCCRHFSASAARGSEKVYEFRTYAVAPSRMREAMKIVEELLPYRQKFSKMNGHWYTELGGLNEMHFLWEFGWSDINRICGGIISHVQPPRVC